MNTSANSQLLRRLNRSTVLDFAREHSPTSATEISRALSLTLPTVMRILFDLQAEGLIRETGSTQASGGRPRSLIEFNPTSSAVIGVDLSGSHLYGTVADLGGQVQAEISHPWDENKPDHSLERLEEVIDYLIHAPRPAGQVLRGIGIGAPGVTLADEGIVVLAVSLGWRDLPLGARLQARFRLPVKVENDVNLAALGEYGFGAAQGVSSLACLSIGTGIGAGIIINRKIHAGYHHSAGEIGYLPPGLAHLRPTYPGFGALESVASGTSLLAQLQARLPASKLDPPPTAESVFSAAYLGQPEAATILQQTLDHLAIAVASITTILDPELIVLGGGLAAANGINYVDPILARLAGVIPVMPRLQQSELGRRAAVMGAIMSVLDATTDHLAINRLA